jgi:predicted hydrolase (HD superfamily)
LTEWIVSWKKERKYLMTKLIQKSSYESYQGKRQKMGVKPVSILRNEGDNV